MAQNVTVDLANWTVTEEVAVDVSAWTAAATDVAVTVDGVNATASTDVAVTINGVNATTTEEVAVTPSYSTITEVVDVPNVAGTGNIWSGEQTDVAEGEEGEPHYDSPNILVINLDDVGIDFLGGITQYTAWLTEITGIPAEASGGPEWPVLTNIQAVADEGVTFLNAYCTPNCSPGRACFQTGRYAFRTGVGELVNDQRGTAPSATFPWTEGFQEFAVKPLSGEVSEYILPKLLSDAGYTSMHLGKWHLAVPNGTPKSVSPFVASRWWEDDPRTGLARGRIPWESNLPLPENIPYQNDYTGHGWNHPLYIGWDEFRGTNSTLERMPNDDLKIPWTEGEMSNGFAAPADVSGVLMPGYYNYLWYNSRAGAVTQETTYVTTFMGEEAADFAATTAEPWCITWEHHALHSPFGVQPDNGAGYSGCLAPDSDIHSSDGRYDLDETSTVDEQVWNSTRSALESIDWNLGQLKDAMGTALWDRTTVIIRCDNGSPTAVLSAAVGTGENFGAYADDVIAPSHLKRSCYEGGIRVPLIIKGPGVLGTAGRTTKERVQATDLFQTILELAGTTRANAAKADRYFDAYSFRDVLTSDSGTAARDFMYFELFNPNGPQTDLDYYRRVVTKKFLTHPTTGATLADSKAGVWKYHDYVNADASTTTKLFRLLDKNDENDPSAPADPYELTDLIDSADSDIVAIKTALIAKLAAVIESEPTFAGDPNGADT